MAGGILSLDVAALLQGEAEDPKIKKKSFKKLLKLYHDIHDILNESRPPGSWVKVKSNNIQKPGKLKSRLRMNKNNGFHARISMNPPAPPRRGARLREIF